MGNSTPHIQKIKVVSKTLPVRDRVEKTDARGDIKVSPCGGINISLSLDRPNEKITVSAKDVRDSNADFVYKKKGGTYDKTTTYGPFPEGEETFLIKEKNKDCVFELHKEVIHCDISVSANVTNEVYDQANGEIEATVSTLSDSVEWRFDGGAWYSGSKTQKWTGLADGDYLVEVRDEWGCTTSKIFTVNNDADTFAPSVPDGVEIVDRSDGEATVVSWNASTDDELSVDHYDIYRSTSSGFTLGNSTRVGSNIPAGTLEFEDTGVVHDTTYYYRVTATDTRSNESEGSTEKEYLFTDDVAPAAPSNLSGTTSDNTVDLDWDVSASPDVQSYNVYVDDGSGFTKDGSTTNTTYSVTGLQNEKKYDFKVTAIDEAGNESPDSSIITETPKDTTPPSAPTGLSSSFSDSNDEVTLTWDANTEDDFEKYKVYRGTSSGGPYTKIAEVTTESYVDSNISIPQTYYYVLKAVDDDDLESSYSSEKSITTGTVPSAPTGLSASYDDVNDEVNLDWYDNPESDLSHYDVYRSTSSEGSYTEVSSSDITVSNYTDSSVSLQETYYYVIKAVDKDGIESGYSTETSIQTGIAPAAPTGLTGSYDANNKVVSLSWDQNTEDDFEYYNVYRSTSSGGPYTEISSLNITTESYSDGSVSEGTTYYYVITAVDDDELESDESKEISVDASAIEEYSFIAPGDISWSDLSSSGSANTDSNNNLDVGFSFPELLVNVVDEGNPDYMEIIATTSVDPNGYTMYGEADDGGSFTWNLGDSNIGTMSEGDVYGEDENTTAGFDVPFVDSDDWTVQIEDPNGNVINAISKGNGILTPSGPVLTKQTDEDKAYYRDDDTNTDDGSEWEYESSTHSNKNNLNPNQSGDFVGSYETIEIPVSVISSYETSTISWTQVSGSLVVELKKSSDGVWEEQTNGTEITNFSQDEDLDGETISVKVRSGGVIDDLSISIEARLDPRRSASPKNVYTQSDSSTIRINTSLPLFNDADKVRVYRSSTSGGSFSQIGEYDPSNSSFFDDTNVSTGSTYYYKTSLVSASQEGSLSSEVSATAENTTYTFTNAGSTGRLGPSQTDVDNEYSGTSLEGLVTVIGEGIQEFNLPAGEHIFRCEGAQPETDNNGGEGGKGAIIEAKIEITQDRTFKILVGQQGFANSDAGSGAGGSFIAFADDTPVLVAGGGGGSENGNNGQDGRTFTSGGDTPSASGGTGGGAGQNAGDNQSGGAGFTEDAVTNETSRAFVNGGYSDTECCEPGNAGFGCGGQGDGGSGDQGGGGGGGYSGGGASKQDGIGGGGGGSFIKSGATSVKTSDGQYEGSTSFNGNSITNLGSYNTGQGRVIIETVSI